MAAVYDGYERLRRERHLIDFESVLELTAAIVLEHRGAAEAVRDTFRYFVVDEYQDVNPLQKLLLDAWLGDRDDLCVVGDPHQVIYSFTGATPDYLTGFTAEFPGATLVRLVRDYRSTPQVVTVANQLIRSEHNTYRAAAARAAAGAHAVRRRCQRGRRGGDGDPVAGRGGCSGSPDRGAGPDQRRHRTVRAGAGRGRGAVRGARRRAVLRAAGGPAGPGAVPRRGGGRGADGWRQRPPDPAAVRGPARADRHRLHRQPACGGFGGPRALGVARRPRPAGRRHARGAAAGRYGRLRRRAGPARRTRPRAAGPGRDARLDARGQGAGVGRGAAAGPGRGADADRARQDARRDRGGKTATVCGGDQGAPSPVSFLVAGSWRGPAAVAVPR